MHLYACRANQCFNISYVITARSNYETSQDDGDNQDGLFAETHLRAYVFSAPGPVERNGTLALELNQVTWIFIRTSGAFILNKDRLEFLSSWYPLFFFDNQFIKKLDFFHFTTLQLY